MRGEVVVSYSESETWRKCPDRWRVEYFERWRGPQAPGAASLGTLLHAMFEQLHRPDLSPAGRQARAWAVWRLSDDPRKQDAKRIFEGFVEWAREEYQTLGWTVVSVEQKFVITLPSGRKMKGAIDMVVRNRFGQLIIVDFKTSAMPPPTDLRVWPQGLYYAYALNQLGQGWAEAVVWLGISTKPPPVRETTKYDPFRMIWMGIGEAQANWAVEQLEIDIEDSWGKAEAWVEAHGDDTELQYAKHPGKENCRFCPILTACDAGRRYGSAFETNMYTDLGLTPGAARNL